MATRNKTPLNTASLTPAELATWQNPIPPESNIVNLPAPDDEDFEEPETGVDRIAAALGGVTDDERAFVKLQRVIGPNKFGECDQYSIADYEAGGLKMIRDTWGPGEYDIRLYGMNRDIGRFGVLKSARVTILPKKDEGAPVKQANSEVTEALRMIAEGQTQMLRALTERPAAPDPMAQLVQMAQVMKLFGVGPATPAPAQGGAMQIKEMLETMRLLKETSQEFGPNGGKSDEDKEPNLMGMLPNILDLVKTGMAQNQQVAANAPALPAPPVTLQVPPPAPSIPEGASIQGNDDMDIGAIALFAQLKRLVVMAQTNADPNEGAKVIFEKIPDDFIDLMETPEWFTLLSQVAPDVKPYQAWFTMARDAALKMFEEVPEDDTTGASPAAT